MVIVNAEIECPVKEDHPAMRSMIAEKSKLASKALIAPKHPTNHLFGLSPVKIQPLNSRFRSSNPSLRHKPHHMPNSLQHV